MMGLAHDKVSESTARLTLAQEMIKVIILLLCIAIQSDTYCFSMSEYIDHGKLLEI